MHAVRREALLCADGDEQFVPRLAQGRSGGMILWALEYPGLVEERPGLEAAAGVDDERGGEGHGAQQSQGVVDGLREVLFFVAGVCDVGVDPQAWDGDDLVGLGALVCAFWPVGESVPEIPVGILVWDLAREQVDGLGDALAPPGALLGLGPVSRA
jgi:hypothetical protein